MEEEIFKAIAKDGIVKVLGIQHSAALEDLHIYVNGVDITKSLVLEEVRITSEKKGSETAAVLVQNK